MLYSEYFILVSEFPGWGITEIKNMTRRERTYWHAMAKWRKSQHG